MTIFAYMLCGIFVGVVARLALPATRLVGFWSGVLLGAVGGLIGGLIGSVIAPSAVLTQLHPLGFVLASVCSVVVSVGVILLTHRRPLA